ncbi:MAG TPA: hypothetical protein P5528_00200 [Steroidobacteraceae bacterium]|nr:hypothetical protein [Steroidobacteraceae bacterium]
MPTGITRSRDQLRKRVNRFFAATDPLRADVVETLRGLEPYGRVFVFGGAIRDLALYGSATFPSDIDVVMEAADFAPMVEHLRKSGAARNRFGGFRFTTKRWKFDVWRLEDTWALREGHVRGSTARTLLATTFFNWDAIAYDFSQKRLLVQDGYFDKLDAGLLGINLAANPNPAGNARRALRMYASGRAGLESGLVQFVAANTRSYWERGLQADGEREFPGLTSFLSEFRRSAGGSLPRRDPQMPLT